MANNVLSLISLLGAFFLVTLIYALPSEIVPRAIGLVAAVCVSALVVQVNRFRRLARGLRAERRVGDNLDRLVAHGCRVLHDVPLLFGNVDHVVLSPVGVFAVETKHVPPKSRLTWRPHSDALRQAKKNAAEIAGIFREKGLDVWVSAVLVAPDVKVCPNYPISSVRVFEAEDFIQWLRNRDPKYATGLVSQLGVILRRYCDEAGQVE